MCSVHVYLQLFHLMVLIGEGEPGNVFQRNLCSGEDLEMQVDHAAVVIYVVYNGEDIAKSSNVSSMKWDKHLPENYEKRLSFKIQSYITIILKNVLHNDTGLYRIVTKSSKGIRKQQDWNVTVLVPPSVDEKISISEKHVNERCFNLTCGIFLSLGKPEVHFNWTVSDSREQTVTVCGFHKCECHAVGPATKCLNRTLSAEYCISNPKRRRKRSPDDKRCSSEDSKGDVPGTDPINPVPIVLATIIAGIVITGIIVFYKRRSGPPVDYNQAPVEENHDMQ